MQQELRAARPDLNIEILGVNAQDQVGYNYLITATNGLPWLQDTVAANVWTNWGVTWRDVRILDSANRLQAVFNLTTNDLSISTNYTTLRQLFLQLAKVTDADNDGLPDDWEIKYFGSLAPSPLEDPDGDGFDNLTEFAFGSDPTNPRSVPSPLAVAFVPGSASQALSVTARRRVGSVLDYFVESSPDLLQWTTNSAVLVSFQNRFDGTGTADATWLLTNAVVGQPLQFLRVRASPRSSP